MPTSPSRQALALAFRSPQARRWALTALTALTGIVARAALQPVLGDQLPFLVAYPATVFAAVTWGFVPGLAVAAACGLAVGASWIAPYVPAPESSMHLGAFAVTAIFICLVCNLRHREPHYPQAGTDDGRRFDSPLASWLRAVLWGSILIPLSAFVAAASWGYEQAVRDARAVAARAGVLVAGQAERTFDVAREIAVRADAASQGEDARVRGQEAEIHLRLSDMVAGLPSVVNLNVWDANGRPLVRSDRYPSDHVATVADRPYFNAQRPPGAALGISDVLTGRQTGRELMNASIRRTSADGTFRGIVAVSLSPEFFRDYYRSLARENPNLARFALIRTDGTVLSAWPQASGNRVPDDDAILRRIRAGQDAGDVTMASRLDGQMRFVNFQRVKGFPLYVVAGVSRAAMLSGWLRYVGLLAALVIPVTAGLAWVSLLALRKTRREHAITAALNDALRQRAAAEKSMLEGQKLETLAQLTGGVAHDFNNLLAIVNSSLHVHRHLHPELAEERHVQAMFRAVQSGTRLTRQLLSFSRKQALRPEVIALQAWLPGTEGLLRSTLGSRVSMAVHVDEDVRTIEVDVAEFELALINLALNAKHAMPQGGTLRIGARNATASEDGLPRVSVAVTDTGVGIPPDVLPRVFEPFYTTRMNEAGSGLGLSQVHGFCAQAGGSARIDSVQGVGTTVEMLLPAGGPAPAAVAAGEPASAESLAGRVMLVEDNEDVAVSTAAILQAAGLEVTHLWSADTAWAALQGGAAQPDVVLSDIEMPGRLSGMDLAFRVRERWPRLPVVLMTGYAKQLEDAVSGGLRVLPKPTPPGELLRELRRAMGLSSVVATAAVPPAALRDDAAAPLAGQPPG